MAHISVLRPPPAALSVEPPAKGEEPEEIPAALLPVTLLLVRLDRVNHGHLHLKLPVAGSGPICAGQSTTAHADLDLLEFLGADARREGTLLYAVGGSSVAGPFRLG